MAAITRGFVASSLLQFFLASAVLAKDTQYIYGTSITGVTQQLAVDRTPALYTGDFGDCLGGPSLFNITRFDAAYYSDNSTVLFHLDGQSSIANESLMMTISMFAYGQSRFQMTFDPCLINIYSLCPVNASVPITAWAVFNVGPQQVGDIPDLAFTIPDFEGSVKLQIFGNASQSEISCLQASLNNGVTMAYPEIVSPILAVFTLTAMIASFVTAAYGVNIPTMRTHYAHSLSVVIVMEAFQSIFFSGALQLSWPSILVAWRSNFAWSTGQIYNDNVLRSVGLMTRNVGNSSQVGDASSSVEPVIPAANSLAQQIYGRLVSSPWGPGHHLFERQPYNASDPYDYTWAGDPVHPGVALPGTWVGFRGTLAALNLPAADAFAVGLIWLLVLIAATLATIAIFKCGLELLAKMNRIKKNRVAYFRQHWSEYALLVIFRTLYAAFAMVMTLAILQFSLGGSPGAEALAAVFFIVFLVGFGVLFIQACRLRLKNMHHSVQPDILVLVRGTLFRYIPFIFPMRMSSFRETDELPEKPLLSLPFLRIQSRDDDPDRISVHQDEAYVKRFGWLTARYRLTKWWFFSYYSGYQLIRAAIIGGGSATPEAQVYSLLVYDVVAFLIAVKIDPFEGRRNTALAVWMLGVSKILTTALSIAFLPSLDLDRITATAIGVIIIAIQGLLAIAVVILIVLGAISSYLSLSRDKDFIDHKEFEAVRLHYFKHIENKALDIKISRAEKERLQRLKEAEAIAHPVTPSFTVKSVRRVSKIYDEDEDAVVGGANDTPERPRFPRSGSSLSTHSLPRGARAYRASWSSLDFAEAGWIGEEDEEKKEGEEDNEGRGQDQIFTVQNVSSRRRPETMKRFSAVSTSGITFNTMLESFEEETEERDCLSPRPAFTIMKEAGLMKRHSLPFEAASTTPVGTMLDKLEDDLTIEVARDNNHDYDNDDSPISEGQTSKRSSTVNAVIKERDSHDGHHEQQHQTPDSPSAGEAAGTVPDQKLPGGWAYHT